MLKTRLRRYWKRGAALLVVVIAVIVFLSMPSSVSLPSNADQGGAIITYDLLQTTQKMQQSFQADNNNAPSVSRQYVKFLNDLATDCKNLKHYKGSSLSGGTASRMASSFGLCTDLSPVVTNSQTIYNATFPLLTTSPNVKFYQTLPIIKSIVRNHATSSVNKALNKLKGRVTKMSFPTAVLQDLNQLQTAMKTSPGLSYYPALQNFQNQLLSERVQYWTDYVGISDLVSVLKNELSTYCQNLKQVSVAPACKN